MATLTITSSNWDVGQIRITYTAANGALTITEIEGRRTDGYRSWSAKHTSLAVSVGGVSKTIALSHYIDFSADSVWTAWGATDTSWTGLTGTSVNISITMPSDDVAYDNASFAGSATMSWSTYTVSYNANGGSGAPSSQTKSHGVALTLSSTKPTREGYTFSSWNTKSDGSGTSYSSSGNYTSNSSATLYAIWNENYLTVNYYSNYATESFVGALNAVGADKNVIVRTSQFYYDNDYTENGHWDYSFKDSSTYLGRTGYTATGYWGTSSSGGILVKQSDPYASGQAMAEAVGKSLKNGNATVNLYAQWQINYYNVAYNANGGIGSMNSQSVAWNTAFTILNNTFSREGYKFVGWNLYRNADDKWYVATHGWLTEDEIAANGYSKLLYQSGRELTLGESWINGNEDARQFTYYAIWEISGVVYLDRTGSVFEPYLVYMDNGTGWDIYLAYIDNGTSWDIIS